MPSPDVVMSLPDSPKRPTETDEWAKRKSASVRLGLIFGAVVFAIFLLSIWKYRPA